MPSVVVRVDQIAGREKIMNDTDRPYGHLDDTVLGERITEMKNVVEGMSKMGMVPRTRHACSRQWSRSETPARPERLQIESMIFRSETEKGKATMSITQTARSERPIGHLDLLKATYGVDDTLPLQVVVHVAIAMFVMGANTALLLFNDGGMSTLLLTFALFMQIAFAMARTGEMRFKLKTLSHAMTSAPYVPELAYFGASLLWGFIAAYGAVTMGGIAGFLTGLLLAVVNPLARLVPGLLFNFRAWNSARLGRQSQKYLDERRMQKLLEGLGG